MNTSNNVFMSHRNPSNASSPASSFNDAPFRKKRQLAVDRPVILRLSVIGKAVDVPCGVRRDVLTSSIW